MTSGSKTADKRVKSTHRDRIEENAGVFDFTLADEVMAQLDALDETEGTDRALESKWW